MFIHTVRYCAKTVYRQANGRADPQNSFGSIGSAIQVFTNRENRGLGTGILIFFFKTTI